MRKEVHIYQIRMYYVTLQKSDQHLIDSTQIPGSRHLHISGDKTRKPLSRTRVRHRHRGELSADDQNIIQYRIIDYLF